jgi:hypothetical protein
MSSKNVSIKMNPNASNILKSNPLFKQLFQVFDKKLVNIVDSCSKQLNSRLLKVELKLKKLENSMFKYINDSKEIFEKEIELAETLVNKEMRSKILVAQWTNYFLALSDQIRLDPITFTFARYSLNICICYGEVPAEYFSKANVHKQLVSFANFESELIVGPAVMALSHLSLHHPDLRPAIASADAFPMILRLMVYSNSRPILINVCKLCASLALHYPNKACVVNTGCLHAILDLILGSHKDFVDENIQFACLCAVVNTVSGSDANRVLIVELNGIKPILDAIQMTSNNSIIHEALKALANISYCNAFAAGKVLS